MNTTIIPPNPQENIPPPDPEINLASFMNPISDQRYDPDAIPRRTPGSPETYFIYDKMSHNLVHADRAIARFNYISGTQIFRKDGRLVWVIIDEAGDATITRLDKGKLRIILSMDGSTWVRDGKDIPVEPPEKLIDTILSAPSQYFPQVPVLTGIHVGTLLMPTGDVISEEGYHEATGLYLTKTTAVPPVPEHPDEKDLARARATLSNLYEGFLFADTSGEDSVDYQNTILALATAIYRVAWPGPLPIWVVGKNSQRTGGSLLQSVTAIAAYGRRHHALPASRRQDEMDKIIRTIISEDRVYGMIDNIERGTNWTPEILLSATSGTGMTATRDMGTYQLITRTSRTFFVVNGINIDIRADVAGRVFTTRLVAPKSWQNLTWTRTKTELETLAETMHPEVIWAFAVFARHWADCGKPAPAPVAGNISEYAEWHRVVCGQLYAAGYTQVLTNLHDVQTAENDAETEGRDLLARIYLWKKTTPFTSGELAAKLLAEGRSRKEGCSSLDTDILSSAPDSLINSAIGGRLTPRAVSAWLREYQDRKISGAPAYLTKCGSRTNRGWTYVLESGADVQVK